jgi:hypothetical protein
VSAGTSAARHGIVVAGHGVASGTAEADRFPGGTIALQRTAFAALGFDLGDVHNGTVNVDVAPYRLVLTKPQQTLERVEWLAGYPAETFSFATARLALGRRRVPAMVYHPHPETKPEHGQQPGVVELLAPWISGLVVGAEVEVWVDPAQGGFVAGASGG